MTSRVSLSSVEGSDSWVLWCKRIAPETLQISVGPPFSSLHFLSMTKGSIYGKAKQVDRY